MSNYIAFGDDNATVGWFQAAMNKLGFAKPALAVDNAFGNKTLAIARAYQTAKGLTPDGKVGPLTTAQINADLAALDGSSTGSQPPGNPPLRPATYAQIRQVFGQPGDENNLGICLVPDVLTMFPKEPGGRGFYCHKLLVPIFGSVFRAIVDAGLAGKLISFDGCYNDRVIAGSSAQSLHSWAIAIDLNADTNQRGDFPGQMDKGIISIFEKYGFFWGGHFRTTPDPMHFEYSTGAV